MKFGIYAAAFLPVAAGALQGGYLSQLSQQQPAVSGGRAFVPGGKEFFPERPAPIKEPPAAVVFNNGYREGGKIFYTDPATTPSNPLSASQGIVTDAPDCTKPPQVSMLSKGTYERLNGGLPQDSYLYPDPSRTPSNPLSSSQGIVTDAPDCTKPPQVSMLSKGTYERLNGGLPQDSYLYPDPARTFSNPLAASQGIVTDAPDCTKPPQVSMLSKGTYERLNGGLPQDSYLYPDPSRTPSNPLSSSQGIVTDAPDCTKPPQVSMLSKGTYERLNGGLPQDSYLYPDPARTFSNPLAASQGVVTDAPDCTKPPQVSMLNKGTYERLNGGFDQEGYIYPDPANTPSNPLSSSQGIVTNAPDCTKPPTVSTLNKGTYETLNGYGAPVTINPRNPFANGF